MTTSVILLWHFHQPLYKDPATGRDLLPFAGLHGTRSYFDMARVLEEFPAAHVVGNFVPSLLDQLEDYALGRADDPVIALATRPPKDLGAAERVALLTDFFT